MEKFDINEKQAYDILISLEDEIERVVKITQPEEVPLLDIVFEVINSHFDTLYKFVKGLVTCDCLFRDTTTEEYQ